MTDPGPAQPRPPSAAPDGPSPWQAPSPWAPPDRQPQPVPTGQPEAAPDAGPRTAAPDVGPPADGVTTPVPGPTGQSGVPGTPGTPVPGPPYPVPTGPGAAPPFAAPPAEGRTARVWIGLGVAALALMLCCGGGTVALVGLIVTGAEAIDEQARIAVGDYFEAVSEQDFGAAYDMLCAEAQRRESASEFARRLATEPEITTYEVGQVSVTSRIVVPVEVNYARGGGDTLRVSLNQDTGTGELEVCGVEG